METGLKMTSRALNSQEAIGETVEAIYVEPRRRAACVARTLGSSRPSSSRNVVGRGASCSLVRVAVRHASLLGYGLLAGPQASWWATMPKGVMASVLGLQSRFRFSDAGCRAGCVKMSSLAQ